MHNICTKFAVPLQFFTAPTTYFELKTYGSVPTHTHTRNDDEVYNIQSFHSCSV